MINRRLVCANRVAVFALLLAPFALSAGPTDPQPRGFIPNDYGEQCWYTQIVKSGESYFHEDLTGSYGVLTFDDPQCMAASELGLSVNKMNINNIVSKWYSHPDANFQTRESELYEGSQFQVRGQCIQSNKYPIIGITIDYIVRSGSIVEVVHGSSVGGCMD